MRPIRERAGRPTPLDLTPKQAPKVTQKDAKPMAAAETPAPTIKGLIVTKLKAGWALMVDDLEEPAWTLSSKAKASKAAKETAKELGVKLVIQKANGKVHKTLDFAESA